MADSGDKDASAYCHLLSVISSRDAGSDPMASVDGRRQLAIRRQMSKKAVILAGVVE